MELFRHNIDVAQIQNSSAFKIDLRGPSSEADCVDCLVSLPIAVERMRAAADDCDIPNAMLERTLTAFVALDGREGSDIRIVAAMAQDHLYRYVVQLVVLDAFTRAYFAQAIRYFFAQLSGHGVRTFYILDNVLRDDRLTAVIELFDCAGVSIVTPRLDGMEWPALAERIRTRLDAVGHVAYIEPDGAVNHIADALALARDSACIATFRNLSPEDCEYEVVAFRSS